MLKIKDLDVSIGQTKILHNINLKIEGFVSIVGRNGAGKTTLMRTIMGFIPYRQGIISFNKDLLISDTSHKRTSLGIGYMPEDRRLVPDLSVLENIMLPSWAANTNNDQSSISWIFDIIPELDDLSNRKAYSLSGGQQKLVAIARSLTTGNKLLLLDEPFEGVAPALANRILELIINLKRNNLIAVITESDETHSSDFADFVFNLERGEITN